MAAPKEDQYSDAVATKRMEDALRRALNTPHKSHTEEKHPRVKKAKPNRRESPKPKKVSA